MALSIKKTTDLSEAQRHKVEAMCELTREPTKRLNCEIPASMHTALKVKVAQSQDVRGMREAIEKLIQGYLDGEYKLK